MNGRFLEDVVSKLRAESGLGDVLFTMAFEGKRLPNPMERVHVSVEIVRNDNSSGAFCGYFGKKDGVEQYGTLVERTLGLRIYLPLGAEPSEAEGICEGLEGTVRRNFGVKKCQIGAISYDRETRALVQKMEISLPGRYCVASKDAI